MYPNRITGQNSSTSRNNAPLSEQISEEQREMQARLAYEELVNPPSRRQEGGQSRFERAPAHGVSPHALVRQGHSSQSPTWSTGEHISHRTDDSFDFGLEASPRSQTSGTSRHSGLQGSISTTRQSSGDDATVDVKRRKNTEASARFRVKKKEKMEQLEQNMTQLQQTADSLEKEAGDLRRENGWLKEMVVMKQGKGSSSSQGTREHHQTGEGGQHQGSDGSSGAAD